MKLGILSDPFLHGRIHLFSDFKTTPIRFCKSLGTTTLTKINSQVNNSNTSSNNIDQQSDLKSQFLLQ